MYVHIGMKSKPQTRKGVPGEAKKAASCSGSTSALPSVTIEVGLMRLIHDAGPSSSSSSAPSSPSGAAATVVVTAEGLATVVATAEGLATVVATAEGLATAGATGVTFGFSTVKSCWYSRTCFRVSGLGIGVKCLGTGGLMLRVWGFVFGV